MTTTYDPKDPRYWDEADMRDELLRVYDLCHGCRLCFNLCPSFPTLFRFVDDRDGAVHELTVAEQDQVVDECFQCKICYVKCPYIPPHEWLLDFPRLLLRAAAVRKRNGAPAKVRLTDNALGRTDLVGRLGTATSGLANRITQTPGTGVRRLMEKVTGISAERVLPPFAKQRFSTWFRRRTAAALGERQGDVTLFQTCMVEYQAPQVGQALVGVYERNGLECHLADGAGCCGAPFLHAGDFDAFEAVATKNVKVLADHVRAGRDVVVPQPTCGYVLRRDYPEYVAGEDAELLRTHVFDASEYLVRLHKAEGTSLDTTFDGEVPESITYHVPCHLQAQNIGLKSRDLMKLTGAKITLVNRCTGIDGTWGYRAENYAEQQVVIRPLVADIAKHGGDVVVGDCHLANTAIDEATSRTPLHPMQVMARAYGISAE